MKLTDVINRLSDYFDDVKYLSSSVYEKEIIHKYHQVVKLDYPSMFVVSLAYPKKILKHQKDAFVGSNYTFGEDYHLVLKRRMKEVMSQLPFEYLMYVDNHPLDERLAASLSGIGYLGKNQLIITKDYGTYHFLGIILVNQVFENNAFIENTESCGECTKCIDACPGKALSEDGYLRDLCLSSYNQEKRSLTKDEIKKNYLLFGCDICQLVCPKNIHIKNSSHQDFNLSGKEVVQLDDLVNLSSKEFGKKYQNMAYLWKGKNILLRNAITLISHHNQLDQLPLLIELSKKDYPSYLLDTLHIVMDDLNSQK